MPLTGPVARLEARGNKRVFPVAADAIIYAGSAVGLNAAGDAVEPTAGGLQIVGVADTTVDNTDGAAGDKSVTVQFGCFGRKNSAGGDAITKADVRKTVYFVDGNTVAKADGGGSRSAAGTVSFIEDGVPYINIGSGFFVG